MWIVFVIATIVALLDQITKLYFELNYVQGEENSIINNFFYFTKTYNTGAAWSSFSDNTVFLCLLSVVCSVLFIFIIIKTVKSFKRGIIYNISFAFILGGTVGNLVDRFLTTIGKRDGVIDFISLKFGNYSYPVFNLADSFLVVGVILLVIDILFFFEKRKKESK